MKDNVKIKATDKSSNHFEIKRELSEVVSRTDLKNRLDSIDGQIEATEEQLSLLKKNRKIIANALESGKANGTTDAEDQKLI